MSLHSFMLKKNSVTLVFDNGPRTVREGHESFQLIIDALKNKDWAKIEYLLDGPNAESVAKFSTGELDVVGEEVLYNGKPLSGYLVNKIKQFMRDDLPWEHLAIFCENLQANPSMRARQELYKFLETEDMPITEDGHFLAYKRVRDDFKDWHSGTVDNSIGRTVEMPREMVDDNQSIGCSAGLHAGSLEYVRNFHQNSGHVVIVKVNPADVVCIPNEDCRKLRCCKYKVLKAMKEELTYPSYSSNGEAKGRDNNIPCEADVADEWNDIRDDVYDDIEAGLKASREEVDSFENADTEEYVMDSTTVKEGTYYDEDYEDYYEDDHLDF